MMIETPTPAPPLRQPRRILAMFNLAHGFTVTILRGIIRYQREHEGWMVFHDDPIRFGQELALLYSGKWDGVICGHTSNALAAACTALKLPLVDLHDGALLSGVMKIRPNNIAVGHMGAEHLLERRFNSFGFSGFNDVLCFRERREGFQESLELAGKSCKIHEVDYPTLESPVWDAQQIELLGAWLRELPRGTAVMACNDIRALQVIRAAAAVGLRVPEDIAVLGANNDTNWCELASPEISSVALNFFDTGFRAAEQLDALIDGQVPTKLDIRIDPVGVVERGSTDVIARRDPKVAAALQFIYLNACRGITVEEVAAQVHASRSQMECRFRRYLGHSPQVEIRRVQVEKIRHLLSSTDLTLKEIADQVGFDHVESLCVVFKRVTGETMGQYRKNIRAQEQVRALA